MEHDGIVLWFEKLDACDHVDMKHCWDSGYNGHKAVPQPEHSALVFVERKRQTQLSLSSSV